MNHQLVPKDEDAPLIKLGKKWTARLVIDHLFHAEIEDTVKASGVTGPREQIALWSKTVTNKFNSFTAEEKMKYGLIADQWTSDGPPAEVKQWFVIVRGGGSSNTRLDLDRAHSYDVGVLLVTLT